MTKQKDLHNLLYSLIQDEQLFELLGVKEDFSTLPEKFVKEQRRTASTRFYWFILDKLNFPLFLEINDLSDSQIDLVIDFAAVALDQETFSYEIVRNWYKSGGNFLVVQSFEYRREVWDLRTMCFRVLFIFAKGVKYLAYDENGQPVLAKSINEAHEFAAMRKSELTPQNAAKKAILFETLKNKFGANAVKVCIGRII